MGQRVVGRNAEDLDASRVREGQGGDDADAQPGEGPRARADGHELDILRTGAGVIERASHEGGEQLGRAAGVDDVLLGNEPPVETEERHRHGGGRGVEGEEHQPPAR